MDGLDEPGSMSLVTNILICHYRRAQSLTMGYWATNRLSVMLNVEQPDSAPKPEGSLEVGVKVGFLDVL